MTDTLTVEQFKKLKLSEKRNYIKEWSCKCKNCGKKWHYLDSVEKQMKTQACNNSMVGLGMCCNPCGGYFSNKSIDLQRDLKKMKQCPKCQSSNVKCEAKYFKKE